MDIGLDIGAAAYAVGYIATWRRLFWTMCDSCSWTIGGDDVAAYGFGAGVLAIVWPVALPIWSEKSRTSDWKGFVDRVGTPPKQIRQETKVKALEKRNKELERQLDL